MWDPAVDRAQADAIRREHREAVEDGNLELATRIMEANPDLFGPHVKTIIEIGNAVTRAHKEDA